jgi:hypothetical protein
VPGAEVLGGEVATGDLADVVVDVPGQHVVPGAVRVPVGEQLGTGVAAALEPVDDPADLVFGHGLVAFPRALGRIPGYSKIT